MILRRIFRRVVSRLTGYKYQEKLSQQPPSQEPKSIFDKRDIVGDESRTSEGSNLKSNQDGGINANEEVKM